MHIVLFTLSISHLRFNRQLRQWLKKKQRVRVTHCRPSVYKPANS